MVMHAYNLSAMAFGDGEMLGAERTDSGCMML